MAGSGYGIALMARASLLLLISMQVVQAGSMWAKVEMAPPDPILGVAVEYNKDPSPKKVNLGIGAYRDDNGKPLVLKCVREAEKKIANDENMNKEYLPIQGLESFLSQTSKIIFGEESPVIKEQRVAVVQSLSGTGALRLAAEFIAMYYPSATAYIRNVGGGVRMDLNK
eukprot:767160-Hanusia_phi.AAC.2